jgi:hypothetical protein
MLLNLKKRNMKKYPKHRKTCGYTTCDICGKRFIARGIGTHRREAHKMIVRKLNYYSKNTFITTVSCAKTSEDDCSWIPSKNSKLLSNEPSSDKIFPETLKNRLSDCNKPQSLRLYTDLDLWIIYGRIRLIFYSQFYPPHIMKSRLIQNFEDKFECKFDDAKELNPHINPEKKFSENPDLSSKYAAMKYSR